MKKSEVLKSPFPYFGGKSGATSTVWAAFGEVKNYVEPFAGSAAMLLGAPPGKRVETVNDKDGFVANFWRAISKDPEQVAHHADWPVNETDLFARHSWLVRNCGDLSERLSSDPDYFDAKVAGWWAWGACAWIGSGWCSGSGPWVYDGVSIVNARKLPHLGDGGQGVNRQIPHLNRGQGINRKLPHLSSGQGINHQIPHLGNGGRGINKGDSVDRTAFIQDWFRELHVRMRDVRVTSGDWARVVTDSVTVLHGLTAVFLDPPYTLGDMQYAAGGCGGELVRDVQAWCATTGQNPKLRIVLCGHAGEHDALLAHGWHTRVWKASSGYKKPKEGEVSLYKTETLWCSPYCIPSCFTL
jgi:site-specific DNA-adenine methylase